MSAVGDGVICKELQLRRIAQPQGGAKLPPQEAAEAVKKADAPPAPNADPKARDTKTTESPAQTGAGQPHPGNKPEHKPEESDVPTAKGGGQNQ